MILLLVTYLKTINFLEYIIGYAYNVHVDIDWIQRNLCVSHNGL